MHISPEVKKRFPGIKVVAYQLSGVRLGSKHSHESEYVSKLESQVRDYLNDTPEFFGSDIIKAYDVFGSRSCGMKSKVTHLAELVLKGDLLGDSAIVNVVNLMQVYEGVVASVYDFEKIDGELGLVIARELGKYPEKVECEGKVMELSGRELVLSDEEKVLSVVPCCDLGEASVTGRTREILVVVYGNSSTPRGQLIDAITSIIQRILYVSGGKISSMIYLD